MRRSVTVLTWAVATVVVCTLAWTAVDRVAADVTDHPTVVGSGTIRAELAPRAGDGTPGSDADRDPSAVIGADDTPRPDTGRNRQEPGGGTTAPAGGASTSGATSGNASGGSGRGGTGSSGGGGNVAGTPATTTTTAPPPPPPPPPPTTTPTTPAGGPEASVVTAGGSVTAACSGGVPRLVRAVPNAGYGVQTRTTGEQLIVTLRSSTHFSVVEIECEGTRVHFSTSEESTG